ncbi:alpha-galactosidase [Arthrobacter sp. H20]|uniref:alpha-galactosidase n=1 Tax=Arthrobacter sp. H20 TaxID=1267981 RepID=UPI0004B2D45F|nr:alpha-galactosidase [Arthrobacter sp. H20]
MPLTIEGSTTAFHLSVAGTSVVIDGSGPGVPTIVHWGPSLGFVSNQQLAALVGSLVPQRVSGGLDVPAYLSVIPQEAFGWQGTPGFTGHRRGTHISPAFRLLSIEFADVDGGQRVSFAAHDDVAHLRATGSIHLTPAGVLRQQLSVTNTGSSDYEVRSLLAAVPLPDSAVEVLDTTGRHLRERNPQRHLLTQGSYRRESRRGRPGADATVVLAAGTQSFGFEDGLVHAVHLAWSGNHQLSAEKTATGQAFLSAGELLLPEEIILAPGETYSAPEMLASWGDGLNELSARFHDEVRSRPVHPSSPRPVTLNTWEAVYFDHDLDRLIRLADKAAALGVERFVLDDGWFDGRRDDTSGLGDWFVDGDVWPNGLSPLIEQVTARGMEFGLWFEPEMVNLDSKLAANHPDWIIQAEGRLPVPGRQQQVLNLANPGAYNYILERIDTILDTHDISYLKWDHNRDLLDAADATTGNAVIHNNVDALYRLMHTLKNRHPGLEIESCASGGARVDLGVLEHTDRIWTSDCIDPLERLTIQKYTGILLPPELMGMHISGPTSHSTGRTHTLPFRAASAIFGHYGIEWDISTLTATETEDLKAWIDLHTSWRNILHTGHVVHADLTDPAMDLRGTVAADRSAALFAYSLTASSATYPPGKLTFPGLDPDRAYRLHLCSIYSSLPGNGQSPLAWAEASLTGAPLELTGRTLAHVGIPAPVLFPEQSILIELHATAS